MAEILPSSLTLADVESAIKAILTTGQSYSIGGRTVGHANLKELYELRRILMVEQVRALGSGISSVSAVGDSTTPSETIDWGEPNNNV